MDYNGLTPYAEWTFFAKRNLKKTAQNNLKYRKISYDFALNKLSRCLF